MLLNGETHIRPASLWAAALIFLCLPAATESAQIRVLHFPQNCIVTKEGVKRLKKSLPALRWRCS